MVYELWPQHGEYDSSAHGSTTVSDFLHSHLMHIISIDSMLEFKDSVHAALLVGKIPSVIQTEARNTGSI